MNFKLSKSFTLIEVLLAVSIFTILMTMGITSYGTIMNWKKRDTSNNELQAAGRHAMEVMTQEIEKADMNTKTTESLGLIPGDPHLGDFYGFRMVAFGRGMTDSGYGSGGFVRDGDGSRELRVYSGANTTSFSLGYDRRLWRGADALTPSTVSASLSFTGFEKTGSNDPSTYQQPYVTINMTLQSTQLDPQTNQPNIATFTTTVRPQNFNSLGYAEVQSGVNSGLNGQRTVTFSPVFGKTPIVVISRTSMNEDDDGTYIGTTSTTQFDYSSSISDQPALLNRRHYWLAVNGNYPNLLKSGKTSYDLTHDNCGGNPSNSTCVTYAHPFPADTDPISFVMREDSVGAVNMNYVRENTNSRLAISGSAWNNSLFNWVSLSDKLSSLTLPGSTVSALEIGKQATSDSTLNCTPCYCLKGSFSDFETTYSGYSACAFYDTSTDYVSTPIQALVSLGFNRQNLSVVISVANNNWLNTGYDDLSTPQINTPGVRNVLPEFFAYSNLGNFGNIGDTAEPQCPQLAGSDVFCGAEFNWMKDRLLSDAGKAEFEDKYSINWVAADQDQPFKLQWSYQ